MDIKGRKVQPQGACVILEKSNSGPVMLKALTAGLRSQRGNQWAAVWSRG
jgi:hypothetical protein